MSCQKAHFNSRGSDIPADTGADLSLYWVYGATIADLDLQALDLGQF